MRLAPKSHALVHKIIKETSYYKFKVIPEKKNCVRVPWKLYDTIPTKTVFNKTVSENEL